MKTVRSEPTEFELASHAERARFDLLAAFIISGWEKMLPVEEAMRVTDLLVDADPFKAQKIGGYIARGEQVPDELAFWARNVRRASLEKSI